MQPLDLIIKKRDGGTHSVDELGALVGGVVDGSIPDYQLAAWLMAVVWRGMTDAETAAFTEAMAHSGTVLDLTDLPGRVVDKHSTGGVGDKTTLVVGPLAAATGLTVAKMSGRGLGHTGGTLDKLESIPGLSVDIDIARFRRQAAAIGLVVAGQTAEMAPADGKLYALRDVTGTVPSLPLIAASIMSKKIASGAHAIALDVKVGTGAFMPTLEAGHALAAAMVRIGHLAGRRVAAVLTGMEQPLGRAVGNALEVKEAIATLQGDGPGDFTELCFVLAELMHAVAGTPMAYGASSTQGGPLGNPVLADGTAAESGRRSVRQTLEDAITSGKALAKFEAMVEAQGGDARAIPDTRRLPLAPVVRDVITDRAGFVHALNARAVGEATVALGAGRLKKGELVDPAVGVILHRKIADVVMPGVPLATIHARTEAAADAAEARLRAAYRFGDAPVAAPPLVLGHVQGDGLAPPSG